MSELTMHLDEESIQRLLDGELPSSETARAHLAECAQCSRQLAEASREQEGIDQLLTTLDHPRPRITPEELMVLAPRPARRLQRLAAGIAIGLGLVGGAYAMPGSPLPKWVAGVIERVTGPSVPPRPDASPIEPAAPSSTIAPPAPIEAMSGIAVRPGDSLLILFRSGEGESELQVSLVDGSEVRVRAPAGAATFTAGADRILVDHPISAPYEIQIPRTAPKVEIHVGGRRIFLKEGARVTTAFPAGDDGEYILPLLWDP